MESYGITMKGRFIAEKVNVLPTFDVTRDKGRLIYNLGDDKTYIGSDSDWVYVSPDHPILVNHENWITTNENDISTIDDTLNDHDSRITTNENDISTIDDTLSDHIDSRDGHPTATSTNNGFMSSSDKNKLDSIQFGKLPTGAIIMYPSSTVPPGYIWCYGGEISRTEYSNLFNVIGTRYGNGNGSTTFNVPDLRKDFIRGWHHSRSIGEQRSDTIYMHRHEYRDRYYILTLKGTALTGYEYVGYNVAGSGDRDFDNNYTPYMTDITSTNFDGYPASETRPRNINLIYIIKY